jgi:hypothetical protein
MLRFCSVLLLFLPAVVLAQQSNPTSMPNMPGMDHFQPTKMIHGSDNPALIPDSTAYRLYFIAIGNPPSPTANMQARQRAHIGKINGFSQADFNALGPLLDDFKVRFAVLTTTYNAQVEAAVKAGSPLPEVSAFFALRDQLVTDQKARLKLALTSDGLAQLDAQIQIEKSGMSISAPQGGQ